MIGNFLLLTKEHWLNLSTFQKCDQLDFVFLLQIEDTKTLLSTFPGTLLKINIECTNIFTKTTDNICLLTKVEGQTNVSYLDIVAFTCTFKEHVPRNSFESFKSSSLGVISF